MTPEPLSLGQLVATQIRRRRREKEWSVRQLAEECARLGAPHLTEPSLVNIERGRHPGSKRAARRVGADELFVLAMALSVPPLRLLFPDDQEQLVEVAPGVAVSTATAAKWWMGRTTLQDAP